MMETVTDMTNDFHIVCYIDLTTEVILSTFIVKKRRKRGLLRQWGKWLHRVQPKIIVLHRI